MNGVSGPQRDYIAYRWRNVPAALGRSRSTLRALDSTDRRSVDVLVIHRDHVDVPRQNETADGCVEVQVTVEPKNADELEARSMQQCWHVRAMKSFAQAFVAVHDYLESTWSSQLAAPRRKEPTEHVH